MQPYQAIEELYQITGSSNDILAEAAGISAGSWCAGMLILAENGRGLPFDYDELERWTRVCFRVVAHFRQCRIGSVGAGRSLEAPTGG